MLFWLSVMYFKAQRALQWWYQRRSLHLYCEAEKIRDGLLQESFSMRRSLELSLQESAAISSNVAQDWLATTEKFHHALEQLSNRLYSPYIDESLPLAIQSITEPWRKGNAQLNCFKLELPSSWPMERPECNLAIVMALEELLRITVSGRFTQSIYLSLKQQGPWGELMVQVSYPDNATLECASHQEELDYLKISFRFLTSGQCFCKQKDLTLAWYFRW